MKNGVKIINKPEWIKKAQRNAAARKRYYLKRYGNLEKMEQKERMFQSRMDDMSMETEMINCI